MKIIKKSISTFLIFLMLFNTSCYSTYSIKKEEIKPQQRITVITKNDEKFGIITKKVTADTLYGKEIAIAVKNTKSVEVREFNGVLTAYFWGTIILFWGIVYFAGKEWKDKKINLGD